MAGDLNDCSSTEHFFVVVVVLIVLCGVAL